MLKYAIYYISGCIYFKADFYQSNVSTLVVNPFYSDVCFNAFVLGLVYLLWYFTPNLQLNFMWSKCNDMGEHIYVLNSSTDSYSPKLNTRTKRKTYKSDRK